MHFNLSKLLLDAVGISNRRRGEDEHLLAGADEAQVQALGASAKILAIFPQDVATLCPDLVHEAQFGVGRG